MLGERLTFRVSSQHKDMAGDRFVIVTIECLHCKTKQTIHVVARLNDDPRELRIMCSECEKEFTVLLPGKIVGGPFRVPS